MSRISCDWSECSECHPRNHPPDDWFDSGDDESEGSGSQSSGENLSDSDPIRDAEIDFPALAELYREKVALIRPSARENLFSEEIIEGLREDLSWAEEKTLTCVLNALAQDDEVDIHSPHVLVPIYRFLETLTPEMVRDQLDPIEDRLFDEGSYQGPDHEVKIPDHLEVALPLLYLDKKHQTGTDLFRNRSLIEYIQKQTHDPDKNRAFTLMDQIDALNGNPLEASLEDDRYLRAAYAWLACVK